MVNKGLQLATYLKEYSMAAMFTPELLMLYEPFNTKGDMS